MRAPPLFFALLLSTSVALSQASPPIPKFEVASVRLSQHQVGPDYNNQITYSADGFIGRHVTLKRLIAEAYRLQLDQISGPRWLDQNEYEINARAAGVGDQAQIAPMLQALLAARFNLATHREQRTMHVYDLVTAPSGPKIQPDGDEKTATSNAGFHFHGTMRQFADLLALQFSMPAAEDPSKPVRASPAQIPVIDKTGLPGTYDFSVTMRPELGTDVFTLWQRVLPSQLGLRIESRKEAVPIIVVDSATKLPTAN
ncbi:MAG TPA: TIGR03435 family protein [Terracidiphilus sp.]|nr:TIGR03435 family protein [Terracidiphilus sp.]